MNEFLSLGRTTLYANGKDGIPVVTLNYVCAEKALPLPYPDGDWYLRNTAIPALRGNEQIVGNMLLPGLEEYYKYIGLLPKNTTSLTVIPSLDREKSIPLIHDTPTLVQVEPASIDPGGNVDYGFPATDAFEALRREGITFGNHRIDMYAAMTYMSQPILEQTIELQLKELGQPDSHIANNKAILREAAKRFGFTILDGTIIKTLEDAEAAIREFNYDDYPYGIWLKFPTGSGGDLVYRIHELTEETLFSGVSAIRSAVMRAFEKAQFNGNVSDLWNTEDIAPRDLGGLVLEVDARNAGRVLENGSTQFVTYRNRPVEIIGHFRQLTTEEGEYLGNRPYLDIDPETVRMIREELVGVSAHSMRENGYYGVQGVDWFEIERPDNTVGVYITELNSRPTANTPPVIIAGKLDAEEWINTNFYTNRGIRSIDDYISIVGEDLAYGSIDKGLVVPQSFRTHVTRDQITPSEKFKGLIFGVSPHHCDAIMEVLQERGIRFTP